MDKIPNNPNQKLHTPQNDTPSTPSRGTHKSRNVSVSPAEINLDKKTRNRFQQQLNKRQITPQSLDIITTMAKEQHWEALSSAIELHGKTLKGLTHVLEAIKKSPIELPTAIQNQICRQFGKLTAVAKAVILTSNLPTNPQQQRDILSLLIHRPESHDSPIGIIARQQVDDFIQTNHLNNANRQQIVQMMSKSMYSIVTEQIKEAEEKILHSTADLSIKQKIEHAQNERRIEENYRLEVGIKSG